MADPDAMAIRITIATATADTPAAEVVLARIEARRDVDAETNPRATAPAAWDVIATTRAGPGGRTVRRRWRTPATIPGVRTALIRRVAAILATFDTDDEGKHD